MYFCLSAARRVWKNYLPAINGIVYLVDCADHERLHEAKVELDASYDVFISSIHNFILFVIVLQSFTNTQSVQTFQLGYFLC